MKLLLSATALFTIILSASAKQLLVHTVGWNSGTLQAPKNLKAFVGITKTTNPDVIAVAISGRGFRSGDKSKQPDCVKNFKNVLQNYTKVSVKIKDRMGLAIYVLTEHKSQLTPPPKVFIVNLAGSSKTGGMSITFTLYQKRFTFITSRMPNKEAKKSTLQNVYFSELDKSKAHPPSDFLFWFGDLNFRVNKPIEETKVFFANNKTMELLAYDQFKVAQEKGLFPGWKEKKITFKPNYKYKPNTNRYDCSLTPSWTSRVFYKSGTGQEIKPGSYKKLFRYNQIEHKPVMGQFSINV